MWFEDHTLLLLLTFFPPVKARYTRIFLRVFEFAVVFFLPGILFPRIYPCLFFPSEFICCLFRKTLSDYPVYNSPPCPVYPLTGHICYFITLSLFLLKLLLLLLSTLFTVFLPYYNISYLRGGIFYDPFISDFQCLKQDWIHSKWPVHFCFLKII